MNDSTSIHTERQPASDPSGRDANEGVYTPLKYDPTAADKQPGKRPVTGSPGGTPYAESYADNDNSDVSTAIVSTPFRHSWPAHYAETVRGFSITNQQVPVHV